MDVSFVTFLIVVPLVFIGGFVDSIAGGGGLITLPAYLAAGLPSHSAMATNKLSSTIGTSISVIKYAKEGFINFKIAIPCGVLAILGSAIGSNIALLIDDFVLKIVLLALLPVSAIFVLNSKGLIKERAAFSFKQTLIVSLIIAFVIGAYDGFYGPGTGTFLIILLSFFAHLGLNESNGVSKIINLSSNVAATVVFLCNGKVILLLGICAGIANALGNFLGSKFFISKGLKIVRPLMILVLILLAIKVIYDFFV